MKQHCKLYPFLKAIRGNWHNAIFLPCCGTCSYELKFPCEGYLLAADAEGFPILMPVQHFRKLTRESISAEDCRSILEVQAFQSAYSLYIEWHTISSHECPLQQLSQFTGTEPATKQTIKDAIPP